MGFIDLIKNLLGNDKSNARIIVKDLTKICGEKEPLEIGLYENITTPLKDKNITINLNGITYSRKTDNDGIARLNINLPVGVYNALISFTDEEYNYNTAYCKVTIQPVLETINLNMRQGDGSKFKAVARDINHNNLSNIVVHFKINNIIYEKVTDNNGLASLNINLGKGDYEIITSSYGVNKKNIIHIDEEPPKPTTMEGTNLTKNYGEDIPYQCAVYSENKRVAGTVKMNINGVTYSKTPDSEGLYKLNINLKPGSYILRAEFQGNNKYASSSVQNTITIKEKPAPVPKSYEQQILEDFEAEYGNVSSIDGALGKVNGRGYAYYYDDRYSNKETANRVAKWLGANCTDLCQWFWHIGKALNYDVRCIHVGCSGGDGHVRLQFKHPERTGGNWINRDPAAVADSTLGNVRAIWCEDGYLIAYDPSWIFTDLYSS